MAGRLSMASLFLCITLIVSLTLAFRVEYADDVQESNEAENLTKVINGISNLDENAAYENSGSIAFEEHAITTRQAAKFKDSNLANLDDYTLTNTIEPVSAGPVEKTCDTIRLPQESTLRSTNWKCTMVFNGGAQSDAGNSWVARFRCISKLCGQGFTIGKSYVVIKKTDLESKATVAGKTLAWQAQNEFNALAALGGSPNFPRLYNYWVSSDRAAAYLVQDSIPGRLMTTQPEKLVDKDKYKDLIASMCKGFHTMWGAGWAHADHNGNNAILEAGEDGVTMSPDDARWKRASKVVFIDFGLAANINDDDVPAEKLSARFSEFVRTDAFILRHTVGKFEAASRIFAAKVIKHWGYGTPAWKDGEDALTQLQDYPMSNSEARDFAYKKTEFCSIPLPKDPQE